MSTGRSAKLRETELAVLKANTDLTEEQLAESYDEFMKEFPSGKMNKAQFNKGIQEMGIEAADNASLLDFMFDKCDTSGDGLLDFSEYILGFVLMSKNDLDTKLEYTFRLLDESGDGKITYDEMLKFMNATKAFVGDNDDSVTPDLLATLVFKMFGLDRSGKLSKQQFIDGCKNNPTLNKMFGKT